MSDLLNIKTLAFIISFSTINAFATYNVIEDETEVKNDGNVFCYPSCTYSFDASFYSPRIQISFFAKYNPNNFQYESYRSFAVITKEPYKGINWHRYEEDKYYYLSDGNFEDYTVNYNGPNGKESFSHLINKLEEFSDKEEKQYPFHYKDISEYDETNMENFINSVREATVISISFGAGISQGHVPTLEEFCNALNLVKIPSSDRVTDKSMKEFSLQLIKNPETYLHKVKDIWLKIDNCQIKSTPAHDALASFISELEKDRKKVFVYTDNIDDIHFECNILLSKVKIEENFDSGTAQVHDEKILYPSSKELDSQKVVSLLIGQSFDFNLVHSHLYTVAPQTQFFSINLTGAPIKVFQGLNLNNISYESINFSALNKINLPNVLLLQGNAQDIMPKIFEIYKRNSYSN